MSTNTGKSNAGRGVLQGVFTYIALFILICSCFAQDNIEKKDEALDSLLEKLGETSQEQKRSTQREEGVGENSKDLDRHLEELTGRKPKQEKGSGETHSKLEEGMRDIQERLRGQDTGEQTRIKQKQLIAHIDEMIQQQQQGQNAKSKTVKIAQKSKGQSIGANPDGDGTSLQKSLRPKNDSMKSVLADKSAWGHLPEKDRVAVGNASGEEPLPQSAGLIKKYYNAILKKSQSR